MLRRLARRFCALTFLLATGWLGATGLASASTSDTLLIGEVGWAGSSSSTADEWLELWNLGDATTSLAGFKLTGVGGNSITFGETDVIGPRSAFLVANYAASDTKSVLGASVNVVTTTISLSNDTLQIRLMDASGTELDVVGDGKPAAGTSSPNKASMIRQQDGSWVTATSSIGFDEGVGDLGTPGICDGCFWVTTVEPVPEPEPAPEPMPVETTSTEPIPETATSTESVPEPEPEVVPDDPVPPDIRLSRVFPAPSDGKEWVELVLPMGLPADETKNWSLHDANAKLLTLPLADAEATVRDGDHLKILLPSARLNNGGDAVELHRPDGSIAERMTYGTTPHDGTWMKNAEGTAWVLIEVESNNPPPAISSPPPAPIELPTIIVSTVPDEPHTVAERSISSACLHAGCVAPKEQAKRGDASEAAGSRGVTTTGSVETKKTPTKQKAATKTSSSTKQIVKLITFDMLTKIEPNIRIAMTGIVGTKPGILGKHQYVLLASDGHGLLVRGSSKQPSPVFGTTIRVTGTLSLNDDGLMLKMSTTDRWTPVTGVALHAEPRIANFLDPAMEDAWSLVEVTGTVREAKSGTVALDLDGVEASIKIRPAVGYRAARLSAGDTLRVRALADTRGDVPVLYPRQIEDIEILAHAKLAIAKDEPRGLPGWTPFGAAGLTVAVTEGYKRLKRLRDERRIRELAARTGVAS